MEALRAAMRSFKLSVAAGADAGAAAAAGVAVVTDAGELPD